MRILYGFCKGPAIWGFRVLGTCLREEGGGVGHSMFLNPKPLHLSGLVRLQVEEYHARGYASLPGLGIRV